MVYGILLVFSLLAAFTAAKGKGLTFITILYLILDPVMELAGYSFDSSYLFLVIVFMILVLQDHEITVRHEYFEFIALYGVLALTYAVGWAWSGAAEFTTFFVSILGLIKVIAAVLVLSISLEREEGGLEETLGAAVSAGMILNSAAVFLQWLIPETMYDICYELYYSASATGYVSGGSTETWGNGFYKGEYYRYFGLFDTPMGFSCFCIFVMALCVIQWCSDKKFFKVPAVPFALSFACGIMTKCKIFLLMLPVLAVMYLVCSRKNLSKGKALAIIFAAAVAVLLYFNAENIPFIADLFGSNITYLTDPLSAFATRFGSDDSEGYITSTLEIALKNILTGVGPASIDGEPIADCAYIVLLHNGGIVALAAFAVYYIGRFKKCFETGQGHLAVLLISVLLMGISRTVPIFGCIIVLTNFYLIENERRASL